MNDDRPYCILLAQPPGTVHCPAEKLEMKLLSSSLLRNLPLADLLVERRSAAEPLFRVGREGLAERWREGDEGDPADALPSAELRGVEASRYRWIFFVSAGSLALREIDHLPDVKADILWAPLEGVHARGHRAGGYLTDAEMAAGRQRTHRAAVEGLESEMLARFPNDCPDFP